MSFANRYIDRNINYPAFVKELPSSNLGMIVVIPCYDEPELLNTIRSLAACLQPANDVEVFVVVNQSEQSPERVRLQNRQTIEELAEWSLNHHPFFKLHVLAPSPFRKKHAGAGLARKTGMDEAVRRFAELEKPEGLIISLDADTFVAPNYFIELEAYFRTHEKAVGATIKFRHRTEELTNLRHRQGMQLYEAYLRYYKQAMEFTGFPHAIYTVGSAFAVRVEAYVKQGGMNRKQAGEDFYFLHKLTQLGPIEEINQTTVFPSARLSNRVPFGTGPVLNKWLEGDESLRKTYHFQSFKDLKCLFELLPALYKSTAVEIPPLLEQLPKPVVSFLKDDNFEEALAEIRSNSSKYDRFRKRFFLYFNAFKILKYLNFAHPQFYEQQDLDEAVQQLSEQAF